MQDFVLPSVSAVRVPAKLQLRSGSEVKTSFERFEYKYWVSAGTADRIARFVRPYMARDEYSGDATRLQRNTSLYFDSPGYQFYNMHVMRAPSRYKLRIRGYGDPPKGKAFFEVKQKVKTVTLKVRATAAIGQIAEILSGRGLDAVAAKDRKNLENFLCIYATHRVEPKIIIGCYREAFASRRSCEDVRMTFDKEIVYQRARGRALAPDPTGWIGVPTPLCTRFLEGKSPVLIELKFRGTAPEWMMELVQRFNLRREAFSKYVSAVSHMCGFGLGAHGSEVKQLLKLRP